MMGRTTRFWALHKRVSLSGDSPENVPDSGVDSNADEVDEAGDVKSV